MMTAVQLKTELKKLIESEKDISLLEHALRFFRRADQEELWKAKLSSRADKTEADFAAGRVHSNEQVVERFKTKRTPLAGMSSGQNGRKPRAYQDRFEPNR